MNQHSKQLQAEERKTISITDVRELRFKVLKPRKGIIEIVNTEDQGRICTFRISDFLSEKDAKVYAELLRLAPQLLDAYMNNTNKLKGVVDRFEKRVARVKKGKSNQQSRGHEEK